MGKYFGIKKQKKPADRLTLSASGLSSLITYHSSLPL